VAIGLRTLDLARIHERALSAMKPFRGRAGFLKRAEHFFAAAITPIEETHDAALKAGVRLRELKKALRRRTMDLAASNRSVSQGHARCKLAEKTHRKGGREDARLLRESHHLQEHLRKLTYEVLEAQETDRKHISRELQDEIAQTLLSINVRLLALKTAAQGDTVDLKKEIANTQRLVEDSVRSIHRFARSLGSIGKRGATGVASTYPRMRALLA
jgi:signal transduction histidine kinase